MQGLLIVNSDTQKHERTHFVFSAHLDIEISTFKNWVYTVHEF